MKQEISNAVPTEGSEVSHRTLLTRLVTLSHARMHFSRRIGLFLTAALVLILLGAFTSASPAHASGGGCWSYNTWSSNADWENSATPPMYGNGSRTALGLGLNSCQQYIMIKWTDSGYDYYKVDWTRPGLNGWKEFRVSGQSYDGYMYKNFTGIYYGTSYNFAVKGCTSHWYGDSCDDWSPTVGIHT
jgi:hypothetical protein